MVKIIFLMLLTIASPGFSAGANTENGKAAPKLANSTLQRLENFDTDPQWDGHNNRSSDPGPQQIVQDFGYSSATAQAGGAVGEIGGYVRPAAEPAWYGAVLTTKTLGETLTASGKLRLQDGGGNTYIGFFNTATAAGWRTANTIVLRIYGRGDVFYAYVDYCTGKWRAGSGELGTNFANDAVHTWSLTYDPAGAGGNGLITASIDAASKQISLATGHKGDGAAFNRFGILNIMKAYDGAGTIWLDDVSIGGVEHAFDSDPGWDGFQNQTTYTTTIVRPRFDFGYGPTNAAGGLAAGECGGVVWRGDWRDSLKMAFYGDRLGDLNMSKPLSASGRISLVRAVSDGDTLFGWFHSDLSLQKGNNPNPSTPQDFLGFSVGAPSAEGYRINPGYRLHGGSDGGSQSGPYIYPDGSSHEFSIQYDPQEGSGQGRITLQLDQESVNLDLPAGHRAIGASFNRFGIITTQVDGLYELIYYDDLQYTVSQIPRSALRLPWKIFL